MKRFFAVLLAFALVFSVSSAGARDFSSLAQLQQFLLQYSPDQIMASGSHHVRLSGVVLEIHSCNQNNHYQMTLQVDDPQAAAAIGYDGPILAVHFRKHVDPLPFDVGRTIDVDGTLNAMYSSVMVPEILADYINGSEDF